MTREALARRCSSSAPPSLSSPHSSLHSSHHQTLLARWFRRKESSLSRPVQNDALPARDLYGEEEEETKTQVESPIRTLFRSLHLRRKIGPQVGPTFPVETLKVVEQGVLTRFILQPHSGDWKRYHFVLEETMEHSCVRFTLRQFQYLPENNCQVGRLVTMMTLSKDDLVMDGTTHCREKYALELQLATRDQCTDIDADKRDDEESSLHVVRLAAVNEQTQVKWLHTFNTCICTLVAQAETQYRRNEASRAWREPAQIRPMSAREGQRSNVSITRERQQNSGALSCTSSECSNNEHSEGDFPAEEIRAAKKDVEGEDENELKVAVWNVQTTSPMVPVVAMNTLPAETVSGYRCTPKSGESQEECSGNNAADEKADNNNEDNHEDNQGDNDFEEDFVAGDIATQSSVAPYKSAVLAGRRISPYESEWLEDEYTKPKPSSRSIVAAENGHLPRAAFGATSSSYSLFPMLRPQMHSFNANGQVFTLDTRYQLVKPIGNGAYGAVIAVKDVVNGGDHLAVKKITNIFEDLVDAKRILREVRLLGHFKHKNITRLLDLSPPPSRKHFDDMYIITELMETDLHQVIYSMQPMSDDHVKYFLYQMLCALHHIHSAGVLHRDVKPSNILLNANCDLKMCDFGLARGGVESSTGGKQSVSDVGELTEYVVTRWYRAPEIMLNCLNYTKAIDVWAAGCIFAEMLLREPLFPGNDYLHQLKLIINFLGTPKQEDIEFVKNTKALRFLAKLAISKPKKWQDVFAEAGVEVSVDTIDLLSKMLLFNPEKRMSVDAALRHPYLAPFFDENDLVVSGLFDFSFDLPDEKLSKDALIDLLSENIEQLHSPVPPSITPVPFKNNNSAWISATSV